ncbi:MAG: hypothetical protein AB1767_08965 [Bacillota bacterium]
MSGLYELVASSGAGELAIVGMTKNVGKTVTLNYLVRCYESSGKVLGLISAGYDGERFDRLTLKEKPRIYAPAGTLVATAAACFEASEAVLELLYRSSYATPLGEVCLGRVLQAGKVELAGPGSSSGLRMLSLKMRELGAAQILVDGAINRLASAAPSVTGATILSTGAAVGIALEDVIRKTVFRCALLETLPVEDQTLLEAAVSGLSRAEAALIHRRGAAWEIELLRAPIPLLVRNRLRSGIRADTAAIVFGGALVDQLLPEIVERPEPPMIILKDASKIFLSPEQYSRYHHIGGRIRVLHEIKLLAVTLNPTNPSGKGYAPSEFLNRMTEALFPRPVFDLVYQP